MNRHATVEPLEGRLFLHAAPEYPATAEALSATPPPPPTLRINAGGSTAYTDAAGNVWEADRGFAGGSTSRTSYAVANTNDDRLYYERRWGAFTYSVPVENGDYTLTLLFADPVYTTAGNRKFDVSAEGRQVLNDFDIAAAGGGKAAVSRSFAVTVADGALSLSFAKVVENPILSGIRLEPRDATQTTLAFPWTAGAPIPVGRHESGVAVANGQVYVFGGYYNTSVEATRRVDRYDPAADRWTRLADLPEPITHAGVATEGDTVWVVGGFVGDNPGPSTSRVWKYSIAGNSWSAGPSLPAPRAAGGLAKLGRTLHYFGGMGDGTMYTSPDMPDHYVLNLDGGTRWTTAAPLPNPRNHLGAAEVGGKIYAVGGQRGGEAGEKSANEDDLHVYDPATDTWSTGAAMPFGRGHIAGSTFVMNGRIVVAGGVKNGPAAIADVIEYDPPTNTWVALPPLPAPRQAGAAALVGDRIVFTGGETGASQSKADTWVGVLRGRWEKAAAMPAPLGEVAGGVIGNKLYLVGDGSSSTFVYNLSTNAWSTAAPRPRVGDHHAAEVFDGRLYLFGGLEDGSSGTVQVFDPATSRWAMKTRMPFNAGSVSAVRVGHWVYVAGGIVDFVSGHGGTTTNAFARYHLLHNRWMRLPSMPRGVNHAAAATDGRRVYVFGGRAGHGGVEDGFNTVQVYDTFTRTWKSSDVSGSGVAPLPQARGGTGRAVYLNGEFYVLGGETKTGGGATADRVYNRVDVYNPSRNTWRLGPAMPTARHGIYPLLHAGRIYVAGGGTVAGFSRSNLLEVLNAG